MPLAFLNACAFVPVAYSNTDDFEVNGSAPVAGAYAPADCLDPEVVDGAIYDYFAQSSDKTQHEEGRAPWDSGTGKLLRSSGTVRNSSNSGSKVNFSAAPTIYMGGPTATTMACAPLPVVVETVPSIPCNEGYPLTSQQGEQSRHGFYTISGPWITSGGFGSSSFDNSETITSISFNLAGIGGGGLAVTSLPLLTTFAAPDLYMSASGGNVVAFESLPVLTSLEMPSLAYVSGDMPFSNLDSNIPLLTELSFPALIEVGGQIGIRDGSTLESIDLPTLKYGNFDISNLTNAAFTSIPLPSFLSGDFNIQGCPNVTAVSIPTWVGPGEFSVNNGGMTALASVTVGGNSTGASVDISSNSDALTTVDLSAAVVLGSLYIQDDNLLTSIDVSALTSLGDSQGNSSNINNCPLLTSIAFSALTTIDQSVGSQLNLGGGLDALTSVDFSALVTGGIYFTGCPVLTTIAFPAMIGDAASFVSFDTLDTLASVDLSAMTAGAPFFGNCSLLTSIDFSGLGNSPACTIVIDTCNALPALDLSTATALLDLQLNNLSSLASLSTSSIAALRALSMTGSMDTLTSIDFSALITAVSITVDMGGFGAIPTVDFSALSTVTNGDLVIGNSSDTTTISLGALTSVTGGGLDVSNHVVLTALDLSSMATVSTTINVNGNTALPAVALDALTTVGGQISIASNPALAAFAFGAGLLSIGDDVTVTGILDQASVDGVLVSLAALDGTGGTTSYDNHSVDLTGGNASPSATGLAAKTTLEGRGNTVSVN